MKPNLIFILAFVLLCIISIEGKIEKEDYIICQKNDCAPIYDKLLDKMEEDEGLKKEILEQIIDYSSC